MKQLITTWTHQKVERGDIVQDFPHDKYRLVIFVEQETETGALITHIPVSLSKNRVIKKIQMKALKMAFK
jgi:hypothetical protein